MHENISRSKRKRILVTGGSGFIGTNLVSALTKNHEVINLDSAEPRDSRQLKFWRECDIRDRGSLERLLVEFGPEIVVHLAARTDLDGADLDAYSTNTDGTRNVLEVLTQIGGCERAIFASSMYVCEPGYVPTDWEDYRPHTAYGLSKVVGERIVKESLVDFVWTIVRPTSIWGPWFEEPYRRFFDMVLRGRYFHMRGGCCVKTYGYVENTVQQIMAIMNAPFEKVSGSTFYLGDAPAYQIDEWADEIAREVPYEIPSLPLAMLRLLAWCGDCLSWIGMRPPLTSFRLRNMRINNVHDVQPILGLLDRDPIPRHVATATTVAWMRNCRAPT